MSAKHQFLKREKEKKIVRWMMLNPNGNLNKNMLLVRQYMILDFD